MEFDRDLQSLQETRTSIKRAKEAQEQFKMFSQEKVNSIVEAVAKAGYKKARELAQMAVDETGMGVVEHKELKNQVGSMDVYESIKFEKTVGVVHEDRVNKVTEIAYPFGVIAAIIPTTNPTATAINKTLISLKSGNALVVSPHPRAVKCTTEALKICNEAAVEAGAPDGLIGWISQPSMTATNELMTHRDVNLILSTGGGGLVKAAYSSGKPAYGVGPGNVPVYIEKSAPIKQAVKMIVDSKTFDNGTICATEQAIVIDKNVKEMAIREFKNNGTYFLDQEEKAKMEKVISLGDGKINPDIVGKSAITIAEMAGIEVPSDIRLLIAEEDKVAKEAPFSIEKLAPIFALYTADDATDAKNRCLEILNLGGRGHSFSLHTTDSNVMQEYSEAMPVSRLMINTLASIGSVGSTTGLAPSMTLGCGSYGGNITGDNITATHLINTKRVAHGIKNVTIPQPQEHDDDAKQANSSQGSDLEGIVKDVMKQVDPKGQDLDTKQISEVVESVLKEYAKS